MIEEELFRWIRGINLHLLDIFYGVLKSFILCGSILANLEAKSMENLPTDKACVFFWLFMFLSDGERWD